MRASFIEIEGRCEQGEDIKTPEKQFRGHSGAEVNPNPSYPYSDGMIHQ